MKRPPTLTPLMISNSSSSETTPFSSAAVVVIILKVEPGGCGAEKAWPARARTSPLRASSTAMPPTRPARAETAASCRSGSIVVFTGAPARGSASARIRVEPPASLTASSEPPGLPARRALKACSRPLTPTGVSGGKPWRASASGVVFFGDADFAGDVDRRAAERVCAGFGRALGERRAVGGEDRRPRRQLDLVFEVLAAAQAGEDEARVPGDAAFVEGQVELGLRPCRRRPCAAAIGTGTTVVPFLDDRVLGRVGFERAQRRDLLGFAVGDDEVVELDLRAARPGSAPCTSRRIRRRSQASAKRSAASFSGEPGAPAMAPTTKATRAIRLRGSARVTRRRRRSTSGERISFLRER